MCQNQYYMKKNNNVNIYKEFFVLAYGFEHESLLQSIVALKYKIYNAD